MKCIFRIAVAFCCWVFTQSVDLCLAADAPTAPGKVAFTFDCAQWGDKGLDHILQVLEKRQVKATFFVTGKFIQTNPEGIVKIAKAGHEVANHSFEHDKKNSISECNRVARLYKEATGKTMSGFFRAPYLYEKGINWDTYRKSGWDNGYVSLITCDALPEYKHLTDRVFLNNFRLYVLQGADERIAIHKTPFHQGPGHINGASILMHIDGYRYHLLEYMIEIVQRAGYQCATFSEANIAKQRNFQPIKTSTGITMSSISIKAPADARVRIEDPRPDIKKRQAAQQAFANFTPEPAPNRGQMAFTFDCDEYEAESFDLILYQLEKNKVEATFYISQTFLEEYPGAIKSILEHGHEVATRGEKPLTPEELASLANLFHQKTGQKMVRLYRPVDTKDPALNWQAFSSEGWKIAHTSLDTCDTDEDHREISDGRFIAYFKIYMSMGPYKPVPIVDIPYSGSGTVDGAVILMHTSGYRSHMLEKMIKHAREKRYAVVAQSKLKSVSQQTPVVAESY